MFQRIKNKIRNFFLLFFKQEKLTVFVFLFLIIAGLISPQYTLAAWWNPWNWASEATQGFLNAIIFAIGSVFVVVTGILAGLAASILGWIMSPAFINVTFTQADNIMVTNGWTVVRDLSNMFIVLGFVIIGIATILRIREYEAQKKLVPLILIALLINFSLLFTGIIIDASHIIMDHFLTQGGATSLGFTSFISKQFTIMKSGGSFSNDPITNLGITTGIIFFNVIAFFVFLVFALAFLTRYIMLWILVILSPLAFFCWVFDFTKKIWTMWWNAFFQWAFIGIPLAFFLWLADMAYTNSLITAPGDLKIGEVTLANNLFGSLFLFLLPAFILIAGFLVSLQLGGAGTDIIKGGLNILKGTGAFIGKGLGTRFMESKAGERMKYAGGRTLERFGVAPVGSTAQAQQKRIEEGVKRREAMLSAGEKDRVRSLANRGDMAAVVAIGNQNAGSLTEADRPRLSRAAAQGYNIKSILDKRPDMTDDPDKILKKMSADQVRKTVHENAFADPRVIAGLTSDNVKGLNRWQLKTAKQTLRSPEKRRELGEIVVDHARAGDREKVDEILNNARKILGTGRPGGPSGGAAAGPPTGPAGAGPAAAAGAAAGAGTPQPQAQAQPQVQPGPTGPTMQPPQGAQGYNVAQPQAQPGPAGPTIQPPPGGGRYGLKP